MSKSAANHNLRTDEHGLTLVVLADSVPDDSVLYLATNINAWNPASPATGFNKARTATIV